VVAVVAVVDGGLVKIVEVNWLAVRGVSCAESEGTVGVWSDWVRCVISGWGGGEGK
jgi:hypothetical protein